MCVYRADESKRIKCAKGTQRSKRRSSSHKVRYVINQCCVCSNQPQVPTSFATTASTKQSEQRRSKTGSGSGLDFHLTNLTRAKTDEVATPSIVAGAHRHHRHRHQPKIVREYGLLSQCSNKYVQVTGKRVDSKAGRNNQYGRRLF